MINDEYTRRIARLVEHARKSFAPHHAEHASPAPGPDATNRAPAVRRASARR